MSDVPGAPPVQFDDQPIGPGEWDERFWEIKRLSKTRAVVLLGKSVADSVLLRPLDVEWDWFFPIPLEAPFGGGLVLEAVVVPHPSGNSRVYNDPEMRRAAHDAVWTAISRLSS